MSTRMILTGHELLDGRIADTNAQHVGAELRARGSRLASIEIVPDGESEIRDAIVRACTAADLVIISGGMGPTDDDNTRHAIASAAGVELVDRPDARERLDAKYAARGRTPTAASYRQALLPAGATLLPSEYGTADAFEVRLGNSRVVALPGVPSEFRPLLAQYVLNDVHGAILRRRFVCFGTGEAELAARLDPIARPEGLELSWRILRGTIVVEVSGTTAEPLDAHATAVRSALAPFVVFEGDGSPASQLLERCVARRWRLMTAESCTGGAIASSLTDVPGASRCFDRGVIVYANGAKEDLLDVSRTTLDSDGAVSRQTAHEMVSSLRDRHRSDVAIAVTGIAGPGGGTAGKPVGLVYVGVAVPGRLAVLEVLVRGRTREQFKEYVTTLALVAALRAVDGTLDALRSVSTVRELFVEA